MDINLSALHFLRPGWLLLSLFGALLPLLWLHNHDLRRRLRGNIAPHLLPHLLITPEDHQRLRPVHLACALLVLGGLATAGPTWQQDRPDFLENRAPLIIALDLSPSMDASDLAPTRRAPSRRRVAIATGTSRRRSGASGPRPSSPSSSCRSSAGSACAPPTSSA